MLRVGPTPLVQGRPEIALTTTIAECLDGYVLKPKQMYELRLRGVPNDLTGRWFDTTNPQLVYTFSVSVLQSCTWATGANASCIWVHFTKCWVSWPAASSNVMCCIILRYTWDVLCCADMLC